MRWLFRLFLSLTFIVSFGHDVVHAHAVHAGAQDVLKGIEYQHHQTALADRTRNATQTKLANRHKRGENHKVYIVEADEEIDESLSHNRLPDHVDILSAVFQLHFYGIYFKYINKYLPVVKYPPFSPDNKLYLSLKVFRI